MGSRYPSISSALAVLLFTVVLGGCNPPVNPRTKVSVVDRTAHPRGPWAAALHRLAGTTLAGSVSPSKAEGLRDISH